PGLALGREVDLVEEAAGDVGLTGRDGATRPEEELLGAGGIVGGERAHELAGRVAGRRPVAQRPERLRLGEAAADGVAAVEELEVARRRGAHLAPGAGEVAEDRRGLVALEVDEMDLRRQQAPLREARRGGV